MAGNCVMRINRTAEIRERKGSWDLAGEIGRGEE